MINMVSESKIRLFNYKAPIVSFIVQTLVEKQLIILDVFLGLVHLTLELRKMYLVLFVFIYRLFLLVVL